MKPRQSQTDSSPKRRRFHFWLGIFSSLGLLIALPSLLYYGYCWGFWGRDSLRLQYYFQCSCPPASEEARYPDEVDVIVHGCHHVKSILSPGGKFLYVQEQPSSQIPGYFLDLPNNEKTPFFIPIEGNHYFLTDDLLFLSIGYGQQYPGGEYILDRNTGKQYPIQSFRRLQPKAYSYGKLHLDLLLKALVQVEEVFFIDAPYQPVIALSSDFRTHPENSFTFDTSALSGDEQTLLEQFLEQNYIITYHIAATFPHEVVSPDGRLIAQDDGIYLMETNQLIAEAPPAFIRGWTSDGRGAIYSSGGLCLKWRGVLFGDNVWCEIWVPQPVIILKVPEAYMLPSETP